MKPQAAAAGWLAGSGVAAALVAVLLAVFSLYSHPHLLHKLATLMWACF